MYEGLRKSGNGQDLDKVLDTATKYYLRMKWGDHVATSIQKTLGITDAGTIKRMFNSLKAWEGALYIGLNPGSWIRNGINNKADSKRIIKGVRCFVWDMLVL